MHKREPAQIAVVGIQAGGRLALRALDFGKFYLWSDRSGDARGDPILQLEDIVEGSLEAFRPKVRAGGRVDQLPGDADTIGGPAHATFKHVADSELPANLLHVDSAALVREARVACDHKQPADARQGRDDFL